MEAKANVLQNHNTFRIGQMSASTRLIENDVTASMITQDSQGRHEGDVTNKALFTPLNVIPETGIASSQATTKQGRGRPLGSRNKVQHPPVQLAKRPRGRPRLVNKPTSPKPKHAIGRPPKPKPLPTIVKVGGLNCIIPASVSPAVQRGIKPTPSVVPLFSRPPSSNSADLPSDTIVPPENPIEFLDPSSPLQDGDDSYSGLMEDGLGSGDEEEDDEEEDEDTTQSNKRRQCNLPMWLMKQFNQRLEECRIRNAQGLPALYYNNKTFWFPTPSPFFLLGHPDISPQDLMIARFFLWDPGVLCSRISCPNCSSPLTRHGHARLPRRCIDLTGEFWIIGFEYRCGWCAEESRKGKKGQSTFRSWDKRILQVLPRALAAEFPAHLSHRNGLSRDVFMLMRSSFQCGVGAKQFADTLRVLHLQAYDELHLQYLHALAFRRGMSEWQGRKYEDFLPFTDRSPKGPHGFVPCSQWYRNMYDKEIESHQDTLNQCIAMCSGEVCAIDHSHKITKHISRVNGVMVFTGLLTVTNEKGEIRICALVATKSHSQFELALKKMKNSLDVFGHTQPRVFYTDNVTTD